MFENVLGHKENIQRLEKTIVNDIPSHAYVFYGKEGIGKLLIAKEFAKGILKTNNLESCVDYKYISPYEDKQNILVEQIREELIDDVYIAPAMGSYKVYVINDAHKMNLAAQNALLKTLEEPPKSVVIILVTSNIDGLIGTILSRTTNIFFNELNMEDMKKYLNINQIDIEENILEFSDGSIGTMINIVKQENRDNIAKIEDVVKNILLKNKIEILNIFKDLDFKNNIVVEYFEFLLLKNKLFSKIPLIEDVKNAIILNANEEMQKTKLAIKLLEWGV